MRIDIMTIEDYDELFALWIATPGMGLFDVDDSREGIARYLERNPETSFVARDDDGLLMGAVLAGHDGRRGFIHHTAVREQCRRRGVARALMDRVYEAMREQKIPKVFLVVYKDNDVGNALWDGLGYTVREDILYRDFVLMPMKRINL